MITLLAPAKINATLEILGRREDGYHSLRSVMLPVALYDRIELEPASGGSFRASDPALATDNLVERALAAAGLERAYSVMLHKNIPVGGGLGGGSSDAAAILTAAMTGELGPPAQRDWLEAARRLGSDVPFFLCRTGALVEGYGERVTALGALPDWWVLVVRPHAAVATGDAYRRLDDERARLGNLRGRPRSESVSLASVDALQRRDFAAFTSTLQNDFQQPILAAYPAVARAAAALSEAGAERALLSGSGSCLFAAFESQAPARDCAARLDRRDVAASFAVPFHRAAAWR